MDRKGPAVEAFLRVAYGKIVMEAGGDTREKSGSTQMAVDAAEEKSKMGNDLAAVVSSHERRKNGVS